MANFRLHVALLSLSLCACGGNGGTTSSAQGAPLDAGADADGGVTIDAAPDSAAPPEAGNDAGTSDAGPDAPDAFVPQLPLVRNSIGGPVLAKPRLVPIVYASDPLAKTLPDYVSKLASSSYWAAATKEYGVGALVAGPAVVVGDAPPKTITGTAIASWIASNVAAAEHDAGAPEGGAPWPAPDGNTIYMVFYPEGTTIQSTSPYGGTSTSCVNFGGYHDEVRYAGGSTPFAVIARCSDYLGLGGTDFVTFAASHEAIEAATDPFTRSYPAFDDVDFAGSGWSAVAGGPEVGDLCKLEPSSQLRPADLGYLVQRTWSNAAAAQVHDPCVPAPAGEPYFVAVPDLAGTEVYPDSYAYGIAVAPGSSVTVDVHLYADGPGVGEWTVSASEPTVPQLPDPAKQLTLTLDKTQGSAGDVLHLTIARAAAQAGHPAFGAPFVLTSTMGSTTHSYWGVVGN